MCADTGNWQAYQPTRLDRIGTWIDAQWPRWQFIAALFVAVGVAVWCVA